MNNNYVLSEKDVEVIKSALYAHIRRCKDFITLDNEVSTFTNIERTNIEERITAMEKLLVNM